MSLSVVPKKVPPPEFWSEKVSPKILTQHHAFYYHIDETIRGTDSLPPQLLEKKIAPPKFQIWETKVNIQNQWSRLKFGLARLPKKKKKEKKNICHSFSCENLVEGCIYHQFQRGRLDQ